ncbi:MAG: 50S ribosomal protein L29 [Planctomycetota bacterium]
MKAKELRDQNRDDLLAMRERLLKEQHELRFKRATEKLEHPHRLKAVRKEMARILTVLREQGAVVKEKK